VHLHGADVDSRRRLRSTSSSTLLVPPSRRSTLGDRAFPIAVARASAVRDAARDGLTIWWALRASQRWGPTGKLGGEGAEIEMPMASTGSGMVMGCLPPQPTRGSGERRKLPSGVRGGAPAENGFW